MTTMIFRIIEKASILLLVSNLLTNGPANSMRRVTYEEWEKRDKTNQVSKDFMQYGNPQANWGKEFYDGPGRCALWICAKKGEAHVQHSFQESLRTHCPLCDGEEWQEAQKQKEQKIQQEKYQRELEERQRQQVQEQWKREQEERQRREAQKQKEERIQQEKKAQEEKIREKEKAVKERELEQRVRQLERENEELRKKMISLSVQDPSSITSPPQIIPEDQVTGYCVSALLKRDPQIFFPWTLTKKISALMDTEFSSDKSSLPKNILVEGGKSLLSYVKEELEKGLDADIIKEGKDSFKKMVSNIAVIQGSFWTGSDSKSISTVPALIQKLNEGNIGKEWITGWNDLGADYKKYIAATVLYRLSNDALPKEYKDIEPYLK